MADGPAYMNEKDTYDLPRSWELTSLGEVCEKPQYGYTTKAARTGSTKLLRTTDITPGKIDWSSVPYCTTDPEDPEKYLLRHNDIVVSRAGSVGISHLVKEPERSVFASYLIRFLPLIDPEYVRYFLESPKYWEAISEHKMGIAVPNVNASKLSQIGVPIAPVNEQRRIVDKIEELFSELDNGVESLKIARAQLKTYRESLLKAAFEGRLTEQWRRDNDNQLETADQLLQRIREERKSQHQRRLEDWKEAVARWEADGKRGRKPRKPTAPKKLSDSPEGLQGALPTGWGLVRIADVADVGTGVTPLKKRTDFYKDGTIPWVTSGAVNDSYVREPSGYVTETALNETNLRVYPEGTLLVAMYGEGRTRGKASELAIDAATNQALAAISCYDGANSIQPYLKWFLIHNYVEVRRSSSGGVQPNLNLGIVENTAFPLCSWEEQAEIVNRLEVSVARVSEMEDTIQSTLRRSEALRQSILKRAFEGKLVPQDPDEEPASVLLERIRSEQKAWPRPRRRQRKAGA